MSERDPAPKKTRSTWYVIIRAHDHVWYEKTLSLRERIDVCAILIRLSYRVPMGSQVPWEEERRS